MDSKFMKTWIFIYICIRFFACGMEEFIITPTAWFYIRSFGQTKTFLGAVLLAYNVGVMISSPSFGVLSDKLRRPKTIIIIGNSMRLCGCAIYSIPISEYCPLIGRFLSGVSLACEAIILGEVARATAEKERARIFLLLDGIYSVGSSFGPSLASVLTFNADIFGWKIYAGNSPGFIMTIIWAILMIFTFFLPKNFGMDKDLDGTRSTVNISDDLDIPLEKEDSPESLLSITSSEILCLFYVVFLAWFFTCVVTFYTPLFAMELFHLRLIHVKLLFVNGSLFVIALYLALYIAAEYFQERSLLLFSLFLQLFSILILAIFSLFWNDPPANLSYLLIGYMYVGMPYFSFTLACALLSKIASASETSFYQGMSYAVLHLAGIPGRIIPSFIFTKTSLILFSFILGFFWLLGIVWVCFVFQKLVTREVE